jgi:hypothetical protein
LLAKKHFTQFVGLSELRPYFFHSLTNSRNFNGLQLFSAHCHHVFYIFLPVFVAVCRLFQAVGGLVSFLPLELLLLVVMGLMLTLISRLE